MSGASKKGNKGRTLFLAVAPWLSAIALAKIACHDLWTFEREPYEVFAPARNAPRT